MGCGSLSLSPGSAVLVSRGSPRPHIWVCTIVHAAVTYLHTHEPTPLSIISRQLACHHREAEKPSPLLVVALLEGFLQQKWLKSPLLIAQDLHPGQGGAKVAQEAIN